MTGVIVAEEWDHWPTVQHQKGLPRSCEGQFQYLLRWNGCFFLGGLDFQTCFDWCPVSMVTFQVVLYLSESRILFSWSMSVSAGTRIEKEQIVSICYNEAVSCCNLTRWHMASATYSDTCPCRRCWKCVWSVQDAVRVLKWKLFLPAVGAWMMTTPPSSPTCLTSWSTLWWSCWRTAAEQPRTCWATIRAFVWMIVPSMWLFAPMRIMSQFVWQTEHKEAGFHEKFGPGRIQLSHFLWENTGYLGITKILLEILKIDATILDTSWEFMRWIHLGSSWHFLLVQESPEELMRGPTCTQRPKMERTAQRSDWLDMA